MADSRPNHGKNAYWYISGIALVGGNTWNLETNTDAVETTEFGDTWKGNLAGQSAWTLSIDAYQYQDEKTLIDAVLAQTALPVYGYPLRSDTGSYFSGNAVFTSRSVSGSTTDAITGSVSAVGDGALTFTGFD